MAWRRGQSYSADLAERILAAVDGGIRVEKVGEIFAVTTSYIYKAQKRRRLTGTAAPRQHRGRPPRKLDVHKDALRTRIDDQPDVTIEELKVFSETKLGVKVSTGCMWMALDRFGLTFKKNSARFRTKSP